MVAPSERKSTVLSAETVSAPEIQQVEDPPTLKYRWTIENFSRLKTEKIYSYIFYVGGYKWRVLIVKGNNVDHLSIYVDVVDLATLPNGWSRYALLSLAVVDQIHGKHTIRKDTQYQFNGKGCYWGFASFMSISELYEPSRGYLVNDTCVIEAKVIDNSSYDAKKGTGCVGLKNQGIIDNSSYDSKKETGCVGLKNQGATGFMNSLLQTLFHIPYFRKAVYRMPTTENDMPLALQSLFYKLQHSDNSVDTKELTKSFGWDTYDSFMQHDVQELNRVLCEKLEDKMKGTVVEGAIQHLFEGNQLNYVKCINVNYKSAQREPFYDLQLDVKGCRDVYASFDKYVEVERLEGDNKYLAENHGLQDAKKSVLFIDFPPVLQLQLKRFEYDFMQDTSVKINDRYEFPLQLDLDKDNGKYLSRYADRTVRNLYTLHSVIVHSGRVRGHNYCFIQPTPSRFWLKFDDEKVTKEDAKKALEEQYGGQEELPQTNPAPSKFTEYSNACMLVYIRESDKEKIMCDVKEEDIAERLRISLKEQEENKHKKKEKAEARQLGSMERKFEPNVMCEHIDKRISFKSSQLEDGDSIRYQKCLTFARYPEVPSFLEYVHDRQNVDANLVGVTTKRHLPDVGLSSASVAPPSRNLQPDKLTNKKLFKVIKPSVVFIENHGFDWRIGSGIIWDTEGHIVTNYHVIKDASYIWVTLADRTKYEAKVVEVDLNKDVAVLRIDAPKEKLKPIPFGTSSNLHEGDKIYVIGHPFGWKYVGTPGDIGKLWAAFPSPANGRSIREGILINAFINPGNSGGPLLDRSGKFIGMITETYSKIREACGLGFAVPVDTVKGIVKQFVKYRKVRRPISGDSGSSARPSKRLRLCDGGARAKP